MQTLNIRQFRAAVSQLDHLVEKTGEIIVTRHGKAILRILPIQEKHMRPDHDELRRKIPLSETSSAKYIRQDRDER